MRTPKTWPGLLKLNNSLQQKEPPCFLDGIQEGGKHVTISELSVKAWIFHKDSRNAASLLKLDHLPKKRMPRFLDGIQEEGKHVTPSQIARKSHLLLNFAQGFQESG